MFELKQILLALIDITETADRVTSPDSNKGERVSLGEWLDLAKTGGRAIPAFAGIKTAFKQAQMMTDTEKAELTEFIRTTFDLRDKAVEVIVERALSQVIGLYLLIQAIRSAKKEA